MIQHYSVLNAAFYCNKEVFYVCKVTNGGLYEEKKNGLHLWMRGGSHPGIEPGRTCSRNMIATIANE